MKLLICLALAVATTSAAYSPYYAQHIPVIGPHGVPLDTPEVQHARAEHLAAHGHGQYGHAFGPALGASYGVVHAPVYGHSVVSASHYEIPQIGHDGRPLDTSEVAAAKAHHFAAYAEAAGRHGPLVPVDTPEVQHAKAAHFAAHAAIASRGYGHGLHGGYYRRRRSAAYSPYGYAHQPQHVPVIGPNGVPVDTPAVQHERANHFALFAKAAADAAAHPDPGHYNELAYSGPTHLGAAHPGPAHVGYAHLGGAHPGPAHVGFAHAGPSAYSAPAAPQAPYHGPIHIPVITHQGVPLEPQEVQHARAAHFDAFGKAAAQAAAHPDPYAAHGAAHGHHY